MRLTIAASLIVLTSGLTTNWIHAAPAPLSADPAIACDSCESWNKEQRPFRIYGNTYYVGVAGLSAVIIASSKGLILLDGDLPQSAVAIAEHIRALGYRVEDIKFILNSHMHFDHAGGIAALQRASGAIVVVSPESAKALQHGALQPDDPQYGFGKNKTSFPAVKNVRHIADGETLRVADIAVTAHFTPGHTPGGTTWTWKSCEQSNCVNIVYADSLNAVSSDGYKFSNSPDTVTTLRNSINLVEHLPCDILISVHPEFTDIQGKLVKLKADPSVNPFIDSQACRNYALAAAQKLDKRLAAEKENH
jgi:metallo-beta-lactamase class B